MDDRRNKTYEVSLQVQCIVGILLCSACHCAKSCALFMTNTALYTVSLYYFTY